MSPVKYRFARARVFGSPCPMKTGTVHISEIFFVQYLVNSPRNHTPRHGFTSTNGSVIAVNFILCLPSAGLSFYVPVLYSARAWGTKGPPRPPPSLAFTPACHFLAFLADKLVWDITICTDHRRTLARTQAQSFTVKKTVHGGARALPRNGPRPLQGQVMNVHVCGLPRSAC